VPGNQEICATLHVVVGQYTEWFLLTNYGVFVTDSVVQLSVN